MCHVFVVFSLRALLLNYASEVLKLFNTDNRDDDGGVGFAAKTLSGRRKQSIHFTRISLRVVLKVILRVGGKLFF